MTALTATYALVHGDDHPDVARAFAVRLREERARRGLDAMEALHLPAVDASARSIAKVGVEPLVAARRVGDAVLAETRRTTHMLAVSPVDPAATPIPPALLVAKADAFAVAVGHRKVPGAARAELVVIWAWVNE